MLSLRFFRTLFRDALRPGAPVLAAAAVAVFAAVHPVQAADSLPQPSGKVILTVAGDITVTNADGEARFDLEMLRALGEHSVTTSEFTGPGVHTFKGVLYSDLLKRVGAKGDMLTAKALDNYVVDIPVQDFKDYPVVLAYEKNGKPLRVRSKGPLLTVYPLDAYPELKSEMYESRSVWHVNRLTVR